MSLSHVSVAYWNNRNHNVYAIKLLTKRTSYCHVASATGTGKGNCVLGRHWRRRPLARRGPACQHAHKLSLIYILPCECPGCPAFPLSLPRCEHFSFIYLQGEALHNSPGTWHSRLDILTSRSVPYASSCVRDPKMVTSLGLILYQWGGCCVSFHSQPALLIALLLSAAFLNIYICLPSLSHSLSLSLPFLDRIISCNCEHAAAPKSRKK